MGVILVINFIAIGILMIVASAFLQKFLDNRIAVYVSIGIISILFASILASNLLFMAKIKYESSPYRVEEKYEDQQWYLVITNSEGNEWKISKDSYD